jgi:hypothetical protein
MKIYKLQRGPKVVDWDECRSCVVLANTEEEARMIAFNHFIESEYANDWLNSRICKAEVVPFVKGMVLTEFNYG